MKCHPFILRGMRRTKWVLGSHHNRPRKCCVVGAVNELPKKRIVLPTILLDAWEVFRLLHPQRISSTTGVRGLL